MLKDYTFNPLTPVLTLAKKQVQARRRTAGYVTKFLILMIDLGFALSAFSIALFIETGFQWNVWWDYMLGWAPWVLLSFRAFCFVMFKTYLVIIRYIGEKDIRNVFWSITAGSFLFSVFMLFNQTLIPSGTLLSVVLLDYFILLFMAGSFRVFMRFTFDQLRSKKSSSRLNTVIYGAGELGAIVERVLRQSMSHTYKPVAIFDDNPKVHGKVLNGIPIYNLNTSFDLVMRRYDVKTAIIGIKDLPDERRINFINRCLKHKANVLKIPPTNAWLSGKMNVGLLQNINFEDLLNRPEISLSKDKIAESIQGKVVLVTGCAGSIGSEIVRQILHFGPHKIIGLDQAETPLADLNLSLKHLDGGLFTAVIGDVRDEHKMKALFERYSPQIVFHAAAYKHVPIMELYPREAIHANVKGTMTMAGIASRFNVQKFVMISTDKVVKPSSVMGASKRIAEVFVQSLNDAPFNSTQFITTRFGNVLGSNGSVIPIFKRQIERREPVTVTHPEVTRFFMTIPEACQLVLEAGAMGEGGEIYVFDMGEPVRIADLAEKMIQMAGLNLGTDIEIIYTGLRPGEKLYEELLDRSENMMPTHHPKILCAAVRKQKHDFVEKQINLLINMAEEGHNNASLVAFMRKLIPEYLPQNSSFSKVNGDHNGHLVEENGHPNGSKDNPVVNLPVSSNGKSTVMEEHVVKPGLASMFLRTLGRVIPSDLFASRFPVSVKGICFVKGKIILLENERGEWDLPGGKLKAGESLQSCLIREFEEELDIPIRVNSLQKVLNLRIMNAVNVVVAVFVCETNAHESDLKLSRENFGLGAFILSDLPKLKIPSHYLPLIKKAYLKNQRQQQVGSA